MIYSCPIPHCQASVNGPLRICGSHYALLPKPQRQALASYARTSKGGPAHRASFERAVESISAIVESRRPVQAVLPVHPVAALPYRDD